MYIDLYNNNYILFKNYNHIQSYYLIYQLNNNINIIFNIKIKYKLKGNKCKNLCSVRISHCSLTYIAPTPCNRV